MIPVSQCQRHSSAQKDRRRKDSPFLLLCPTAPDSADDVLGSLKMDWVTGVMMDQETTEERFVENSGWQGTSLDHPGRWNSVDPKHW